MMLISVFLLNIFGMDQSPTGRAVVGAIAIYSREMYDQDLSLSMETGDQAAAYRFCLVDLHGMTHQGKQIVFGENLRKFEAKIEKINLSAELRSQQTNSQRIESAFKKLKEIANAGYVPAIGLLSILESVPPYVGEELPYLRARNIFFQQAAERKLLSAFQDLGNSEFKLKDIQQILASYLLHFVAVQNERDTENRSISALENKKALLVENIMKTVMPDDDVTLRKKIMNLTRKLWGYPISIGCLMTTDKICGAKCYIGESFSPFFVSASIVTVAGGIHTWWIARKEKKQALLVAQTKAKSKIECEKAVELLSAYFIFSSSKKEHDEDFVGQNRIKRALLERQEGETIEGAVFGNELEIPVALERTRNENLEEHLIRFDDI